MAFHVFLFVLVFFLTLSLALPWRLCWFHLPPFHSQAARRRTLVHRLLKPRSPDDCPACGLASSVSAGADPSPQLVRPWSEVKSRRGAPKSIDTEGFACPNQQCAYFSITDAHIHALVGDGKHGRAERIQTFRGPACHTTFSARSHTPLYRLKTPSHQIAMVLSALGSWARPIRRRAGLRLPTSDHHYLAVAGWRAWSVLARAVLLPPLAPSPAAGPLLRTRLRSSQHVLWLWLAIDPLTKILPVLQLGPRTQYTAHFLIHSLRQGLA